MPPQRRPPYHPGVTAFSLRPMTRADAVAVTDLLAAAEVVDRIEEHYSVEDVHEELDDPMRDPRTDWVLAVAGDRVVGTCQLRARPPDDGAVRVMIDGVVHPELRRQGIGSALLERMLARAPEYVRERGEQLRPDIACSGPSQDVGLAKILAAHGMVPRRWSFVMLADLTGSADDVPDLPEDYTLASWEGLDHTEIRLAHNRAFVGHYGFSPWSEQMWSHWVAHSRAFRPALSLVARDQEGAIAAYVQTEEFEGVEAATGVREAYVAKVGTLPDHRRRGLAGLLLRRAMRDYREAGYGRAALDVDAENPTGALGVYQRAGFSTQVRLTSYEPARG